MIFLYDSSRLHIFFGNMTHITAKDCNITRITSDIPRRLITIIIGIPIVVLCLSHFIAAKLFLTWIHILCLMEWTSALLPLSIQSYRNNVDDYDDVLFTTTIRAFFLVSICCAFLNLLQFVPVLIVGLFTIFILYTNITSEYKSNDATTSMDASSPLSMREEWPNRSISRYHIHHHNYRLLIIHLAFGLTFITAGFNSILSIASQGLGNCIYFALIVWNGDTGALVAGRVGTLFHLILNQSMPADILSVLFPRSFSNAIHQLSPNKTITGFVGGIALGTITAVYWPELSESMISNINLQIPFQLKLQLQLPDLILNESISRMKLGIFLSLCGIIGDLLESKVKRIAGQKDSGKLLPGHGGFMDRMDSMLLSAILFNVLINNGSTFSWQD